LRIESRRFLNPQSEIRNLKAVVRVVMCFVAQGLG